MARRALYAGPLLPGDRRQPLRALDVFRGIVGTMARELQASKKAQGAERIYVAGEKEYERELTVRAKGVPINANLRKTLVFLRDS